MNGIEMLLKSMGLDPEAIKAQVTEFQSNLAKLLANFDERLVSIENRLVLIEGQLLAIMSKLTEDPDILPAGPSRMEETSDGAGNSNRTDSKSSGGNGSI